MIVGKVVTTLTDAAKFVEYDEAYAHSQKYAIKGYVAFIHSPLFEKVDNNREMFKKEYRALLEKYGIMENEVKDASGF